MRRKHKRHRIKQVELPLEEAKPLFETRGIFSDHYIKTKLRISSLWPKENEVKPIYEFCLNLWTKLHITLARSNEELTRQEFLEKILPKLGFAHIRNQPLPASYGRKEPDYLLFGDLETKQSAVPLSKQERYSMAISVMEAKKVNHPLDAVSRTETPGRFPHQQIQDYLHEATDDQGAPYFNWAILTNGNVWRLYCRNARSNDYFEFDLEKSLNSFDDFMIFAALFRARAFITNIEGRCPLDDLRNEALQFQTKLEDDLRKRVFNILENLANGFYRRPENKITKKDLYELYQNCLIFLYRLLFILYAEGRGLLPVKPHGKGSNKIYRERYSLQRLIPRLKNYREYSSAELTDLYEELIRLFHLISGDKPAVNRECGVPLYNGRLFDSRKYHDIEKWKIGEKTIADVLRGLIFSTIPERDGEQKSLSFGETIDYADLEVRQLGSIYEGLLENHLELRNGNVQLIGDKTERKATGTYYTPDYIVQYIVKNAIGPLCEEIETAPEIQKAIAESKRDNSFAKAMLKLNILDPAMGSGHFLVRTTEFLADRIFNHTTTALQVEKVSPGLSHEQIELAYWRRRVVESCIYGVDLNPLSVELAKLALWLTCISFDQPLSFLDHHLRTGNSLIGAQLSRLNELPSASKVHIKDMKKQLPLTFGPDLTAAIREAIRGIHNIEETDSKDITVIKNKESKWVNDVLPQIEPYRTIADLWASTFFGSSMKREEYQHLGHLLITKPGPKSNEAKQLKEYILKYEDVVEKAKVKKFLHWELQFPEVFFDEDGSLKENPGFDAVIGNPPYLQKESFTEHDKKYILKYYPENKSNVNLASVFMTCAQRLTRTEGYHSFIVPKSLLFTKAWENDRLRLLAGLHRICDVSRAWKEVLLEQCIFIWQKRDCSTKEISLDFADNGNIAMKGIVAKDLCKEVRAIPVEFSPILEGLLHRCIKISKPMRHCVRVSSGVPYQKKLKNKGKYAAIGGDQIWRYENLGIKGFFAADDLHTAMDFVKKIQSPHIVMQRIVAHVLRPKDHIILAGTLNLQGYVPVNTVSCVFLNTESKLSLNFICALLNSRFFSWYAYNFIYSKAIRSMDFYEYFVSKLPVRHIGFTTSNNDHHKATQELQRLYTENDNDTVMEIIAKCLPLDKKGNFVSRKEKSHVVHDFLTFLAEEMIEMSREKNGCCKEFITWLEKEIIEDSIANLKHKTKIKKFYENDLDTIVKVLKQNHILPKVINLGDERYEKLERAHNDTMKKLDPLKKKISDTDYLIDQIVYKLYGLTEDEIRIVEESCK